MTTVYRTWMARMEGLGWSFVPTEPQQWEWVKFGVDGHVVARQGGAAWALDAKEADDAVRAKRT